MKLFVYGTLKRGHLRDYYLSGQRYLGEAITFPKYRLLNFHGRFPLLVENENGVNVKGEIWDIDDDCLERLDYLEAEGEAYERMNISVIGYEDIVAYIWIRDISGFPDCGDCWRGSVYHQM